MKTILITGSTDGIGKLTALKLAKAGHHILIHGRNKDKVQKTMAEIEAQSKNKNIEGFVSNLADFDSINAMTAEMAAKIEKIDVLINNAGVFKSAVQSNLEGLDLRFAVNYFAAYLLTNQLMPLLEKSEAPRVVNLSSAAQSRVSFEALTGKEIRSYQETYAQSKLALTMWSFHLSKKHGFLNVIAVNPGSLLNTRMVQEAYGQSWSSADKGADILSKLAVSEEFSDSSGKYFDNDKGVFSKAHPDAYDEKRIVQLISETTQILEQK
ncbi:MAG: SDR family NAD(P)-dependent oxidoreductase [Bacteroidota bacterium]